ncbi:MAG: sensor histidine kinase [Oscillospiraceae bacterium]|nr:sensor histidine kinase [Oscillospiraceae bacterium]
MQEELDALRAVLAVLPQPTLLVSDGVVTYLNEAAAAVGITADVDLEALFCIPIPEENFTAPVLLTGARWVVQGRMAGAQLCLTLTKAPDHAEALQIVAQTLRPPVSNLFATAEELFARLEDLEDRSIQADTAKLSRGFYQLLRISGNLADAAEYLAGRVALRTQATRLDAFFTEFFQECQDLCATAGQELSYSAPDRMAFAELDQQKVERAILNLLSNAMKYSSHGGKISLRASCTRDRILITVTDHGEGIPEEIRKTLFSRYDNRSLLGDSRWGTGLGLLIAQSIAQLHGGTVLINSAPDCGTSALLSLSCKLPCEHALLASPVDYTGGFRHSLVELSEVLPEWVFRSEDLY